MAAIPRLMPFQHTAARRRLAIYMMLNSFFKQVSTHSRPKAAGSLMCMVQTVFVFQHTAARRRLDTFGADCLNREKFQHTAARRRLGLHSWLFAEMPISFNTQPPEGGWLRRCTKPNAVRDAFQHTAARRRLASASAACHYRFVVSTHSRPKAAGGYAVVFILRLPVSTHSRPKAAGWASICRIYCVMSFNTQPPEGGWASGGNWSVIKHVSTHSRPKAAGVTIN